MTASASPAPDLTHIGARTTIAGGSPREQHRAAAPLAGASGRASSPATRWPWRTHRQDGKPIDGIKLTTEDEVALVAYLESLK
jgi:hypothetical protein